MRQRRRFKLEDGDLPPCTSFASVET